MFFVLFEKARVYERTQRLVNCLSASLFPHQYGANLIQAEGEEEVQSTGLHPPVHIHAASTPIRLQKKERGKESSSRHV